MHNLSGPIAVTDTQGEPAHPGDLLVVEILNLGALEGDEWGFTGTFDRENGGMHLRDKSQRWRWKCYNARHGIGSCVTDQRLGNQTCHACRGLLDGSLPLSHKGNLGFRG